MTARREKKAGKKDRNLELNLGKVCNNRCIFCLDGNAPRAARKWLPVRRARTEIEAARKDGVESLGLLGGEPTAHPRILEIVSAARESGFKRIALASNGLKLADADFAAALVESGVTRVGISIHGHRAEIEDFLSGRKGNFDKKVRAIKNLLSLHRAGRLPHNVSLNAVLTRYTFRRMAPFCAFFKKMGIGDVRFNMIRTDACMERGRELMPRIGELASEIAKMIAVNERRLMMEVSFGDVPLCIYPLEVLRSRRLASRYVGEIRDLDTSCAVFLSPADELVEVQRFQWDEKKRRVLKVQAGACRDCRLSSLCEGLWRSYVELYGTDELEAVRIGVSLLEEGA
jgi:MoaA/NifB/PqqE/SkfB family radical SAM enzyme